MHQRHRLDREDRALRLLVLAVLALQVDVPHAGGVELDPAAGAAAELGGDVPVGQHQRRADEEPGPGVAAVAA